MRKRTKNEFEDAFSHGQSTWDYLNEPFRIRKHSQTKQLLQKIDFFGKSLEIGCASGVFSDFIIEKSTEYMGIDISENAIKICREKFKNSKCVNFEAWDCSGKDEKNIFGDKYNGNVIKYDTIFAMEMIHYLSADEQIKLLDNVSVSLKKDGYFIISLPLMNVYRKKYGFKKENDHFYRDFIRILKKRFQIIYQMPTHIEIPSTHSDLFGNKFFTLYKLFLNFFTKKNPFENFHMSKEEKVFLYVLEFLVNRFLYSKYIHQMAFLCKRI
jgi:SAM-dependent methyltransferase